MNIRVIPRTALKGYLRLVRTPLDTAIGLLPGNGEGAKPSAQLAVDRADATVRSLAGALLGDPVLLDDGRRRRRAANERERAFGLRRRAEQTAEEADVRLHRSEAQAQQERRRAREKADRRRRAAVTRAQKKRQNAAEAESRRRQVARDDAAQRERAIEKRAPHEELKTLEARSEALRAREKELTARDEARRLAEAASHVKAERKAD